MRLIDADALLKTHCNECTLYPNDCLGDDCDNGAVIHIKESPTVDAVPVRHGKWEHIGDPKEWDAYICDQCNVAQDEPWEYCPHCGAKMDVDGREE